VTPDQLDLVRATVARIGEHPEFATRFYARLFEVAPATAPMFDDVDAQERKLSDELVAMVDLLGDLPRLDERARELGRRHREYGVRAGHYPVARDVMVATLHEVLGEAFGADEEDAWRRGTMLITELMQAG
jgi:nitric oxide dioxygenase